MPSTLAIVISIATVAFLAALFISEAMHGNLNIMVRAERYAKITAKTIVRMEGFDGGGQNAYFYDAAEGLIASTILLVAEFCGYGERHIVSVKIVQELLQTKTPPPTQSDKANNVKPKNEYQKLIELLPEEHKARWFASSALNTAESSMHSVMSTAMSHLLSFIVEKACEQHEILEYISDVPADFPAGENPIENTAHGRQKQNGRHEAPR